MGRKYTDAQKREMVRRYIAGETLKAIANDIGCSIATVSDYVNKHFRGELVLEDNHERNDTMTEMNTGEKTTATKETPAAAATATDSKTSADNTKSYTYDYTSERQFCQVMLTTIIELADDIIADESADAEVAGYAGKIGGLAMALEKALLSGEHEC